MSLFTDASRVTAIGASRPFPCFPAKVPSPNDQQTLSVAARTAIACDRPVRNCGERSGRGYAPGIGADRR